MGYYIRVLGTQDPDIHLDELIDHLKTEGLSAKLGHSSFDQPNKWTLLEVVTNKGLRLAQIERNQVFTQEIGQEEIDDFRSEIQDYKPNSAVEWLMKYFDKVKVIYAFQILKAAFEDNNFEIITSIKTAIWNRTAGILQADNEGFSNEEGYQILWQFSDDVKGEWNCAVIDRLGQWQKFKMDLSDKIQRMEFQNGNVPRNAMRF